MQSLNGFQVAGALIGGLVSCFISDKWAISLYEHRPEAVLCELSDGAGVPALCFNLAKPPNADEANADYAAKLREIAGRLGLPSDYVKSIR